MSRAATKQVVYKYPTGFEPIPPDSTYLTTLVENTVRGRLVWHYFLVWVDDAGVPAPAPTTGTDPAASEQGEMK